MAMDRIELAKFLYSELRKEILEAQKIRTQLIGFKITFVSVGSGLIVANLQSVPIEILVVPALAAVFFDLLINGYSFSIKRIGVYSRCYLEPILNKGVVWPKSIPLWEEFMIQPIFKQRLSAIGNLGITILSVMIATFGLIGTLPSIRSVSLLVIMALLTSYDVITFYKTPRIEKFDCKSRGNEQHD